MSFDSTDAVATALAGFALASFNDADAVERYDAAFGISALCENLERDRLMRAVVAPSAGLLGPKAADLCRLHWLALSRKTVTVLEFGSGFSTAVFADALALLQRFHGAWARDNLRCTAPFHLHSVEEDETYMAISAARLSPALAPRVTLHHSEVHLVEQGSRFATLYARLPNVNPSLIYLDGPSPAVAMGDIRGFSLAGPERVPMAGDILAFEHFLGPGTIVLCDGRTANARYLKTNLQRAWRYLHDRAGDVHLFELQEAPLGPDNARELGYRFGGTWLLPPA